MRRLRHLLLTSLEDLDDPVAWSGSAYELQKALKRQVEHLTVIGNLKVKRTPYHAALRLLTGGNPPRYPLWMTRPALEQFGRTVSHAIEETKPDAVLSISSQCIIYLNKPFGVPVGMFSDAPWLAWQEAYKDYERMPFGGLKFAAREATAARKCDALFFGSDWAVKEAERLYGAAPERIHTAPLGAAWVPEKSEAALEEIVGARAADTSVLRLLFVGKDWQRKGGPLAVEIARVLNRDHRPTALHIVGCSPVLAAETKDYVQIHGLLHRTNTAENRMLRELFLNSHFLLVPTDAECFGLVFAEAFAHALPAVSCNIHAVPSIIDDSINGILQDRQTHAAVYARRINDTFRDGGIYRAMATAARAKYKSSLTWDHCAAKIIDGLEKTMPVTAVPR